MLALDILVFCEHVFKFSQKTWDTAKQYMRNWLGPGPSDFLFIPNTDIIFPATFQHPFIENLQVFDGDKQYIRGVTDDLNVVCRKRLPWLTLVFECGTDSIDLSDWISGIRWNSVQPTLLQIIRLYGFYHGILLKEDEFARIHVITRDGIEEKWRIETNTLQKIS